MKFNPEKEIREKGLKLTPSRLAILKTFSNKCHPLSAEDIKEENKAFKIDLVTIYRTLRAFEKAGLIKQVNLQKDAVYYELNSHHHHIVCKNCGLIEEFENCNIEQIIQKISLKHPSFSTISDHSLELFGICKACTK